MTSRPLDSFICFALYSANQAMMAVYKPHLDQLGLTYPQYLVMTALWAEDGRTVGGLCAELGLATSTVTPLLKRLEAAGHVTRRRSGQDERVVRIRLTESGRALENPARAIPPAIRAATGTAPDDLARLQAEIARLRDRLSAGADGR